MTNLKLFGTKCANCGADYGDHSSEHNRCPGKGFEPGDGRRYNGSTTRFEASVPPAGPGVTDPAKLPKGPAPVRQGRRWGKQVWWIAPIGYCVSGIVLEVVPAWDLPKTKLRHTSDPRRNLEHLIRDHESYVVQEEGTKALAYRYWPKVDLLRWEKESAS